MFPFGVVSQGLRADSGISEHRGRYPCLLVKLTEGMLSGIAGVTQKQGNTEAVPVGRKRSMFTLFLNYIIARLFNICQVYKKSDILI